MTAGMPSRTVNGVGSAGSGKGAGGRKVALFGSKLALTGLCFWYVFRQIKFADLVQTASNLDHKWIAIAALIMMVQIPLVGLRWSRIVDALAAPAGRAPLGPMIAIMAITIFFGQIVPNLMGDAIRAWFLVRLGRNWRQGLESVIIDRGVGIAAMLIIGSVTLLFPSALSGLGGYRFEVLATFALLLTAGFAGLALVPYYAPLLGRFSATRWIAGFVSSSHRVLIASSAAPSIFVIALFVHLLTIMSIWSLGQAFMLNLSTIDSAVLFTLIVGIGIAPITIGGWGLREVAVTAFLNAQGIPSQEALLFSVCFGLVLVVASLPGAIALLVFSPEGAADNTAPTS